MWWILLSLLFGCSGMETSHRNQVRKLNEVSDRIYRNHDEIAYAIFPPEVQPRPHYPWEKRYIGDIPRITKEYFRCRGRANHDPRILHKLAHEAIYFHDCPRHSLPIRNGEEYISPLLLDLLNKIQAKLQRRVVVTCGHRCPDHHRYANPATREQISKHMVGEKVTFYVEGYEWRPKEVIRILHSLFPSPLKRYEKDTDVSTLPWFNEKVFLKLYKVREGRDFDNRHPYPYLSLETRTSQYTWEDAFQGYLRY